MKTSFRAACCVPLAALLLACGSDPPSSPYVAPDEDCSLGSDSWQTLSADDAPSARASTYAVWTGSEVLVWGGFDGDAGELVADGALYDPSTDSWRPLNSEGAPSPRARAGVLWTGAELFVWGGFDETEVKGDGALYDPASDSWRPISADGAPSPRAVGAAVWSGSEAIVWGGATPEGSLATGARYDPSYDTWRPIATEGAPEARNVPGAVWSGAELLVWGGFAEGQPLGTGGRYDPIADSWLPMSSESAPSQRTGIANSVVWTGDYMFVWGGHNGSLSEGVAYGDGGLYSPPLDAWLPLNEACMPPARASHAAVWTGERVLLWGGQLGNTPFHERLATGAAYDPILDVWSELPASPLAARDEHVMVWTGTEAFVWGGYSGEQDLMRGHDFGDGARIIAKRR